MLDIDTSMGDGAQLGHTSSLHAGQAVPAGERWHGSPAQRDRGGLPGGRPGATAARSRRVVYCARAAAAACSWCTCRWRSAARSCCSPPVPQLDDAARSPDRLAFTELGVLRRRAGRSPSCCSSARCSSASLVVVTVPRAAQPRDQAGQGLSAVRLPLLGPPGDRAHDQQQVLHLRSSATAPTSSTTCAASATTCRQVEQTGSNFGTEVKHETPYLSSVGSGTMVADGLSIINADYSSTSFRVSRASIGAHNFLGNNIAYPVAGQDGRQLPARDEGHGPDRRAGPGGRRAAGLAQLRDPAVGRARHRGSTTWRPATSCAAASPPRTGTTSVTMGCSCWCGGCYFFVLTVLAHGRRRPVPTRSARRRSRWPASLILAVHRRLLRAGRAGHHRPSGALRPLYCSIYDPYFWRHERFWKLARRSYLAASSTAPVQGLDLAAAGRPDRQAGLRRRLRITERTLVTIGDDCTLNAGSIDPVPLAGGRRLQVRPHRDRRRLHARGRRASSTTA